MKKTRDDEPSSIVYVNGKPAGATGFYDSDEGNSDDDYDDDAAEADGTANNNGLLMVDERMTNKMTNKMRANNTKEMRYKKMKRCMEMAEEIHSLNVLERKQTIEFAAAEHKMRMEILAEQLKKESNNII